jgi:GT2 family glycosyltransferase
VADKRILHSADSDDFPAEVTHVAALGAGDSLEIHTLREIARLDHLHRGGHPPDLIYTDEDESPSDTVFTNPFFKPAWSPDTLESFNFVGALAIYRRDFLAKLGAGLESFGVGAAYGLVLRAAEQKGFRAERLPWMLYHRRPPGEKERAQQQCADLEALRAALRRREEPADAEISPHGVFHVRRAIFKHERVSILIPTRDRLELLRRCVETLTALTTYRNYEIVILNNESKEPWTLDWLAKCGHRVLDFPGPFNYAAMHNAAVRAVDSPWLCLLNNDTEIIEPRWLGARCEQVQRPEIACVGAKLLFPDGLVQHAGVVLGIQGRAAHAFAGKPAHHAGARSQLQAVRNYSAVTAACMMIRREVFQGIGGFDEQRCPVAYNDVELCVRALKHGYRNVYTPHAVLKHHECATRPRVDNPHEVMGLRETCLGPNGWTDPFYHPSLSHEDANFTLGLE